MGLDQSALQLVWNVVLITAVSSLAIICHMLRQDNKKLTVRAKLRDQERAISARIDRDSQILAVHPELNAQQDIRQFVTRRSKD